MADDETEALREANAARRRKQDRDDLWTELGGLPNGTMRRFVFDEDNPRTPEGRGKKRADEAAMRMAEAMARWDAQTVTIAGVEMTNADAQAARRRVLENPDHYTKWARERGLIKPGQEQEFIKTVQRMHELKERERQGLLEDRERREFQDLERSVLGRAANEATAQAYKDKGVTAEIDVAHAGTAPSDEPQGGQRYALRSKMMGPGRNDLPSMKEILPTAPDVGVAFAAGTAATVPLDVKASPPSPAARPGPEPAMVSRNAGPTPGVDL